MAHRTHRHELHLTEIDPPQRANEPTGPRPVRRVGHAAPVDARIERHRARAAAHDVERGIAPDDLDATVLR